MGEFIKTFLNVAFTFVVESTGCFVEVRIGGFFKKTLAMAILCF